jgi:gluconolactonase
MTSLPRALALAALLALAGPALAQPFGPPGPQMRGDGPPPAERPFSITRSDPALDAIVPKGAKLELLASGFGLNEGPVWVPDARGGYLLVSGLLDNVIYKVTLDHHVSVALEKAGFSGEDPSHTGAQTRSGRSHVLLIGPSCTGLDSKGRLIWCADNDRAVMRLEPDGKRTVLSAGLDGKRFSGPNDITIRADDGVYLADNDFGLRDAGKSPDKQLGNGIFLIRDGATRLVLDARDLGGIPNGIVLSPDETRLYLSAGFGRIWSYEVKPDGSLGGRTLFTEGPGIGDGMKVDKAGNVYSTSGGGPGIVRITTPSGKLLGLINLPIYGGEPKKQICATNVAFGGPARTDLFIAACDAVYRIRLKVAGAR